MHNYFKLFNISQEYTIDLKVLEEKYKAAMLVVHPDKMQSSLKQLSNDNAALINQAYNCLSSPLDRALYLLELHGKKVDLEAVIFEEDFLFEQFALREQLENHKDMDQIKEFNKILEVKLSALESKIATLFSQGLFKELPILQTLKEMMFYKKLIEEAMHKMHAILSE